MTYIHVESDVQIYVQDHGAGAPIVFVAGFSLDHQLWDRQVRIFTGLGHRVVCIDQRGHGKSDKPLGGYEIGSLTDDLASVLRALNISDATLVGHSLGGQVALHTAATCPEVVARLVLVSTNGARASRSADFPFGAPPEVALEGMAGAEHRDRITARHRVLGTAFGREADPRVVDWLVSRSLEMPSWAATECYRSLLTTDLIADLDVIRQPVLQIIGTSDPVVSAKGARWIQERLRDSRLLELSDCGHYPMLEVPDAFESALTEFTAAAP